MVPRCICPSLHNRFARHGRLNLLYILGILGQRRMNNSTGRMFLISYILNSEADRYFTGCLRTPSVWKDGGYNWQPWKEERSY